jgi:hypothetical protein
LIITSKDRECSQAVSDLQLSLDTVRQELGTATQLADSQRVEVEQVSRVLGRTGHTAS